MQSDQQLLSEIKALREELAVLRAGIADLIAKLRAQSISPLEWYVAPPNVTIPVILGHAPRITEFNGSITREWCMQVPPPQKTE